MKRKTRQIVSVLVVGLWLFPGFHGAQDINFEDEEAEPIEGSAANAERMANLLRIADNSILDYVTRSTRSMQQGHRQGFADFRDWYRARRAAEEAEEATQQLLLSLIGSALALGMDLTFPGSSTYATILKAVLTTAYDTAVSNLGTVNESDINQFLDRHESALEGVLTQLLQAPEEFRSRGGQELEAAKWEFVYEALERDRSSSGSPSSEVGPTTRRMLRNMGVPPPGASTARRYRVRILQLQIRKLFSRDANMRQGFGNSRDVRIAADVAALRHIYPNQPIRYCSLEQRLNYFFQTEECRNWSSN